MKRISYIDMGLDSDLEKAATLFPEARRSLMYTPMDLANKSTGEIKSDLDLIAEKYAPCDLVVADIEAGTPDEKVELLLRLCAQKNFRPYS